MVEFYINKHIISDEIEPIQTEPCPIDLFVGTRTHHGTRLSGLRPEAVVVSKQVSKHASKLVMFPS